MNRIRRPLFLLLLLVVLLTPRLSDLNAFVTLDEPFWLSVGGNFYYALGQRELERTVYEYHPAVTTMWIVTAAFLVDFPGYRGFGQGYFDVDKNFFDPFLLEHGISPLHLLLVARLFQILVIVVLALMIYYFLSRLLGEENSFLITTFISSAPYFLGHSRVLSHEAMLAFFVLLSIVSMLTYLETDRRWFYLVISGAAAAIAQLTKSSAMALVPVILLMLLASVFLKRGEKGLQHVILDHFRILGLWFISLVIVYFVLWPGMWVAPGNMLYEVYGNAFSYAFQGARLQVTHELVPEEFTLSAPGEMLKSFFGNVIWVATPLSWMGVLMAAILLFSREQQVFSSIHKRLVLYFGSAAFLFILLFSLAQGRNSPHYIMTSYVAMDAVAALGWCGLLEWLWLKLKMSSLTWARTGIILALILFQLMSALSHRPYYYTYSNPIMRMITGQTPLSDYGEGLEQAAHYLAKKPDAESLSVLAIRGRGPFSYFFPGQTTMLNLIFVEDPGMPSLLERLTVADYLVINDAVGPRSERTALFVRALSDATPEHVIQIKGIQTIRIYRVDQLPASFYETISQ
jgi:hypothetical protein